MASSYDVIVSGADATTVIIPPVDGKSGAALGPAGNGKNGISGWFECKQQATAGLPGNTGDPAPPADGGGNGGDAYSVTIECQSYTGSPLRLANFGGKGGNGNSGGTGGNGSDGGNAGHQPQGCKDLVLGGVGGPSGRGGAAGAGGNGGNAGAVVVSYGSGFSDTPVSMTGTPGEGGTPGNAGAAGTPGKGGVNSDGTDASDGSMAGGGASAGAGTSGSGGNFSANTDPDKPASYLRIAVQTTPSV